MQACQVMLQLLSIDGLFNCSPQLGEVADKASLELSNNMVARRQYNVDVWRIEGLHKVIAPFMCFVLQFVPRFCRTTTLLLFGRMTKNSPGVRHYHPPFAVLTASVRWISEEARGRKGGRHGGD